MQKNKTTNLIEQILLRAEEEQEELRASEQTSELFRSEYFCNFSLTKPETDTVFQPNVNHAILLRKK